MTIICACVDKKEGIVHMGADRSISRGDEVHVNPHSKLHWVGEFLIALSGPEILAQHARYLFHPPDLLDGQDIHQYMSTTFSGILRDVFKKNGYTEPDLRKDSGDFEVLVAHKDRLFMIGCDFSVTEYTVPYAAIGAGRQYAMGAMAVGDELGASAMAIVHYGLDAAHQFDAFCTREHDIVSTRRVTDVEG